MQNKRIRIVAGALPLVLITGLAGCASTTEIESLRNEIRQANEAADKAAASALAARQEAISASQTAAEAKAIAEDAKATAEATDEKVDRMFKKAMYK